MPSNAELVKKIEVLEARFEERLDALVAKLVEGVKVKLLDAGVDPSASNNKISEMEDSMGLLNELVEGVRTKQVELLESNKALKLENAALKTRVSALERYSRINNVEVKGVPVTQGEDCVAIISSIGEQAKCPVSASDLEIVHRVPTKSGQQNIIARFYSRTHKNDFVKKARKARLNTGSLGYSGGDKHAVFVNEHLTQESKRLFAQALKLKKEKGWLFLWTENCQIKARQTEDSRSFRISSESDLAIFS